MVLNNDNAYSLMLHANFHRQEMSLNLSTFALRSRDSISVEQYVFGCSKSLQVLVVKY